MLYPFIKPKPHMEGGAL